ncbi:hypothetical protein [Streptomyces sp. KR80]|uniref:hypothetical protein n=1 Tax=Streptomyces sp. KR80 TaxID=3457426 RepID=UPI003FD0A676
MSRRVSIPGADELFRTTGGMALQASSPGSTRQHPNGETPAAARVPGPAGESDSSAAHAAGTPSGGDESAADDTEGADGAEHSGRVNDEDQAAEVRAPAQGRPKGGPAKDRPGAAAQPPAPRQAVGSTPSATAAGSGSGSGQTRRRSRTAGRRPSGRERHDEKITVYVSAEELMDLEHARLVLRGEHGLAVDRGRIVREAVAVVLADLESRGDASILVRRLRGR